MGVMARRAGIRPSRGVGWGGIGIAVLMAVIVGAVSPALRYFTH